PPPGPAAPPPPPPPPVVPDEPEIFEVVEQDPVLIGGIEGLQARVQYPEMAQRAGVEGTVFVQFVVDERGNVVDPQVVRSPSPLLSEAALRAVRESRFQPGMQRGRPVKVRFTLPVRFVLR
ncbi:MAG: energy transducer TonB, partial [Rubricoccaceae bacterium]